MVIFRNVISPDNIEDFIQISFYFNNHIAGSFDSNNG